MAGKHTKQSGNSIVVVTIAALVILALGATGWFVYQHNRTQATGAASNPSQTTTQQNSTQPAPTVAYLEITEWGVKLPLSEAIKDAYYATSTGSSKGTDRQPNTLLLGLKSLDSNGCAATNNTAVALIFRALPTETDSATGRLYTQEYPNGITVGTYFYAYQKLTSASCTASPTTLQSIDAAFTTAEKGTVTATAAN